ncbi:hypothetical protein NHX12_008432, partial [Muraenolepis orangiensis]
MENCSPRAPEIQTEEKQGAKVPQRTGNHGEEIAAQDHFVFKRTGASNNRVVVPEKVTAVLGKNITLGCRIEVGSNLTQSSWERHLPSGAITIAVFNPEFGISVSQEYAKRVSFLSPSVHDATILLEGVGFADVGSYTCKVSTFPLGNTQASTTVNVL